MPIYPGFAGEVMALAFGGVIYIKKQDTLTLVHFKLSFTLLSVDVLIPNSF